VSPFWPFATGSFERWTPPMTSSLNQRLQNSLTSSSRAVCEAFPGITTSRCQCCRKHGTGLSSRGNTTYASTITGLTQCSRVNGRGRLRPRDNGRGQHPRTERYLLSIFTVTRRGTPRKSVASASGRTGPSRPLPRK